jgi:hypothetical protein
MSQRSRPPSKPVRFLPALCAGPRRRALGLAASLFALGCTHGGPKDASADPLGASAAGAPIFFTGVDVVSDGGVEVDHRPWPRCTAPAGPTRFWLHNPGPGWSAQGSPTDADAGGWGLAVDDFDDDGHLDVFLPDFGRSFLFLGDGAGGLHPAHDQLPDQPERAVGALSADHDVDALPDLIVLVKGGPNVILRNTGSGFSRPDDPTASWGEAPGALWTAGGALGDQDGDGWLDLVTATFLDMDDPELPAALAALRWHGYRTENRYMVFQALPHTLSFSTPRWRFLDDCHRRRNIVL